MTANAHEIGAYEAKTRLSALLDQVEHGDTVTITKHGRPVARLVPIGDASWTPIEVVLDDLRHRRVPGRDGDLSIREMIDEGRA
ncbi:MULTISPECIES: type II toxin-antitoxin system Phd/YefM family antitoxin [Mumia]|uniref:type II toxin-antitoxin system Phd/YefM family antitoxin n=1 Tax=Mumia TaxID=1546255 RepID=UPI0014204B84|nr:MULTISPECIES: type II toxin-antitoxin system prevent-host-death family antitoxin [unclassified Mumia]QMW66128.1 type II toxin-antitoxin system prevent-host-death family antitoxin [Mumia sp. ZJ1417]